MRPAILLFDVDCTLIDTGGAGRRALEAAFAAVVGGDGWLDFSLAGMTDRAIVREALGRREATDGEQRIDRILERYLAGLGQEVATTPHYAVLPGVVELVKGALAEPHHYAVGLGTGNMRRGAQIKLARGGLDKSFAFGGFGSDHEIRSEVIRIGAERGAEQLECPLDACRVVVIGDTPEDVRAARAIGATCVAVATGPYTADRLRDEGATFVCESLADPAARAAVLGH